MDNTLTGNNRPSLPSAARSVNGMLRTMGDWEKGAQKYKEDGFGSSIASLFARSKVTLDAPKEDADGHAIQRRTRRSRKHRRTGEIELGAGKGNDRAQSGGRGASVH